MSETEPRLERETYLEERKSLVEAEREAAGSFDKAMITLSAGALGLSITFIRELAPMPQSETVALLIIAWGGFIVALLSTLSSFLFSQSAMRRQRDILDLDYEGAPPAQAMKNIPATITNMLNWFSIACFIIGVIFLALFSISNLPQ